METEKLKFFNENMEYIGVESREEIHRQGLWHHTFHCWIVVQQEGKTYLLFQKRAAVKKDSPNLLDITAAGHILDNEEIEDGIREVEEEIGLSLSIEQMVSLGIIRWDLTKGKHIDREFCYVYLYMDQHFPKFTFQLEEVSGMYALELEHFRELIEEERENVTGYEIVDGSIAKSQSLTYEDFVQNLKYHQEAIERIKDQLTNDI
ncbi:NUDIX hydrolase [Bacillus horti]|uniref:Isopentenyldiphosphate isomerase n=1 Tax=Caldalkalibacillus horti TaxID=77523 RepID=A0ABT9VX91_9BACI|nr:NUDIX domain-containing protein [Bacillus horti]MDQ0165610.1 isopentenyldiphosphate isomerase [Bacillus horti]